MERAWGEGENERGTHKGKVQESGSHRKPAISSTGSLLPVPAHPPHQPQPDPRPAPKGGWSRLRRVQTPSSPFPVLTESSRAFRQQLQA